MFFWRKHPIRDVDLSAYVDGQLEPPARDRLAGRGARILGDGKPRIGAHGKPVLFLHPKDFCGVLIELEEA